MSKANQISAIFFLLKHVEDGDVSNIRRSVQNGTGANDMHVGGRDDGFSPHEHFARFIETVTEARAAVRQEHVRLDALVMHSDHDRRAKAWMELQQLCDIVGWADDVIIGRHMKLRGDVIAPEELANIPYVAHAVGGTTVNRGDERRLKEHGCGFLSVEIDIDMIDLWRQRMDGCM